MFTLLEGHVGFDCLFVGTSNSLKFVIHLLGYYFAVAL